MLILSTTNITIERTSGTVDPYEVDTYAKVASGVPAHVTNPLGQEVRGVGAQTNVDAYILVGPDVDVRRRDRITDENTGDIWDVTWSRQRRGLGLDHVVCGCARTAGGISA